MAAAALAPSNGTRWADRTIRLAAGGRARQTGAEPALRLAPPLALSVLPPAFPEGLSRSPPLPRPPPPRKRVVAAGPEGARRRAPWRRRQGPSRW